MTSTCECCDHPLQHAIRVTLAALDAPIPQTTKWREAAISDLRELLAEWEARDA